LAVTFLDGGQQRQEPTELVGPQQMGGGDQQVDVERFKDNPR
jgi:hypothetical protein